MKIKVFDTTLRDGEQSPGCSMHLTEKLEVAKQLEKLGVDVIEAGFAIASEGDFQAIQEISKVIKGATVASLARATKEDILRAYDAVKGAKHPRIHTFIATSDIHLNYKLKKTREEVIDITKEMVTYARSLCEDVEFSCEDATRTDPEFLRVVIESAIESGARTINIPDTVGYTTPTEYYDLITYIKQKTKGIEDVVISVHCHNDLGLAVANSLAAISAGATQVECTINGLGERAGNAALEELVMAMATRKDLYAYETNIKTKEIMHTSNLVSYITGVAVQPNKAIVGANAFSHESGIHQHGVLNHASTYEIMQPEHVGRRQNELVMGKHSGKHAFKEKIKQMGFDLTEQQITQAFSEFKALLDKKKNIFDADIAAIVRNETLPVEEIIFLRDFTVHAGNQLTATAHVAVDIEGVSYRCAEIGDGPIDAAFKAIQRITGIHLNLKDYKVHSVSSGKDAQGEAFVKVLEEGLEYTGRGLSTDVIEASILAYVSVMNKILRDSVRYNAMKEQLDDNLDLMMEEAI
ncbi:MAG: 2-isopropylmalate synthase [Clostridia bacterium]|nr:2-isopropylmalate synthase [Clostridia bacterium]